MLLTMTTATRTSPINDMFGSYNTLDPSEMTEMLAQSLSLSDEQFAVLRPAIYMYASSYSDTKLKEARQVEVQARRNVQMAKSTGRKEQVKKSETALKKAKVALYDQEFYTGKRNVKFGDATVQDFMDAIDWKRRHEIDPAQRSIDAYQGYIDQIQSAGVKTLREIKA